MEVLESYALKIIQKFKRGAYRAFCLNSAMSAPSWWISMPFLAIFGVVLDGLLGEPRRAQAIERVFNSQRKWPTFCRIAGIAAWCILIIAPVAAAFVLTDVLPGSF